MSRNALCVGVLLLMGSMEAQAQLPDWLWARKGGVDGNGLIEKTATDAAGNVFVCGYFGSSALLGTIQLNAVGSDDGFVAKLDPSGNWLWAVSMGSTDVDDVTGLVVDADGDAYVTGLHYGDMTIGDTTLAVDGTADMFIAKIDGSGNWIWAIDAAGQGNSIGTDVALGANGALYVCGTMDGQGEVFGPDTIPATGFAALLLLRLDVNGNWQWVDTMRLDGYGTFTGLAYSNGEGVVAVGEFYGTLYTANDTILSGPTRKALIAVVDTMGTDQWAWHTSGTSASFATDVVVDGFGRIFLVGAAGIGTAVVGDSTFVVSDAGDGLVVRVSPNGFWDWSRRSNGTGNEVIEEVAVLPDGQVILAGAFRDGDLLLGALSETNAGGSDAFVAGISTTGNWLLVRKSMGAGDENCYGIVSSDVGNIYVGGGYSGEAVFGSDTLTAAGSQDVYVAKLGVIGTTIQSTDPASFTPVLVQDGSGSVLHGLSDGITNVRVTDASGRIVFQRTGTAIGGRMTLGALDLSVGAFLIQVQQGEQHATLKLVAR